VALRSQCWLLGPSLGLYVPVVALRSQCWPLGPSLGLYVPVVALRSQCWPLGLYIPVLTSRSQSRRLGPSLYVPVLTFGSPYRPRRLHVQFSAHVARACCSAAGKVTVGLAPHWSCVTAVCDVSRISINVPVSMSVCSHAYPKKTNRPNSIQFSVQWSWPCPVPIIVRYVV